MKFQSLIDKLTPERFFLWTAPVFYLLYNLVCPPFQIPDEYNHFYRAYQVSQGHFFAEKKDGRIGGEIPVSFDEFSLHYRTLSYMPEQRLQQEEFRHGFSVPVSKKTVFKDFPNTALYSPVSYLPHALALFTLKKLNCSVGALYYGGRIAAFLLWYLLMFFVIKMLPVQKWLFTMLLLLPMQLYLVSSYSADAMTALLGFLLIAVIMRLAFSEHPATIKQLVPVLLLAVLLVFTKVIYGLLLALILIVPAGKFGSMRKKAFILSVLFIFQICISVLWTGKIFEYQVSYSDYNPAFSNVATLSASANYAKQKQLLLDDPLTIVKVVQNTIANDYSFYLGSYTGHFGAFMGTPFPTWMVALVAFILFLTAVVNGTYIRIRWWQRGVFLITAIILFVAIILSQYLMWSRVGAGSVESLQGRYLILVFPLLLCGCRNTLSLRFTSVFFISAIIFLNVFALQLLHKRYIKENYSSVTSVSSSFESQPENDFFSTSNAGQFLQRGNGSLVNASRTGNYALKLPFKGDAGSFYPLSGFSRGDLFQIDVWKKGEGGQIIVTGCGDGCEDFYFINDLPLFGDNKNWFRLNMTFVMPVSCKHGQGAVFLKNNSSSPVLFDDLRILIKHGQKS